MSIAVHRQVRHQDLYGCRLRPSVQVEHDRQRCCAVVRRGKVADDCAGQSSGYERQCCVGFQAFAVCLACWCRRRGEQSSGRDEVVHRLHTLRREVDVQTGDSLLQERKVRVVVLQTTVIRPHPDWVSVGLRPLDEFRSDHDEAGEFRRQLQNAHSVGDWGVFQHVCSQNAEARRHLDVGSNAVNVRHDRVVE